MPKAKTTKTNDPITLTFELDRETKGTFRFAEVGDDPTVGTLYIRKSALNGKTITADTVVTVSIEVS